MSRRVLVCGLGLMGGSLAAALAAAGWRVLLHHRRPEVARQAADAGFGRPVEDAAAAMAEVDVAVVCTPVSVIAQQVRELAAVGGDAVITDVGSTKARLCAELADLGRAGRFVGSHPMAGSHARGLAHADATLYHGRPCVLTPVGGTPTPTIERVAELWRTVGARVLTMDADEHDRAVVEASQLPHVLAATAAAGLTALGAALASSGFRDTTRVAAGSPALWADILLDNRDAVRAGIDRARTHLAALDAALATGDEDAVRAWLERGSDGRRRYDALHATDGG